MTTQESTVASSYPYTGEASVRFLRARFESEELSSMHIARWLVDHLGPDLTSIVEEDASDVEVHAWTVGAAEVGHVTDDRLRLLYRVTKPVVEEFGLVAAKEFITDPQPTLGGVSVLDVIAIDDPRSAYDRVVPIARLFVGVD